MGDADKADLSHFVRLNGSTLFSVSEGAFTAVGGEDDAEFLAEVLDVGFAEKPGFVKLTFGNPPDGISPDGTGVEVRIERADFEPLLAKIDAEWDDITITIDTEGGTDE